MPDMQINNHNGEGTTVRADALDGFEGLLQGKLLTHGTPGYDEARTIWNGMIDRRPALIVRPTTAKDVAAAVRFAASNNLQLAVRGGGHNIAGNSVCDGGLMIDLSLMNQVDVDPVGKTARVGGGALLGDVDAAVQRHGLFVPVGINSTTGIAGLTLGGGFGWLSRGYGLTIDNLVSAEVVTARGETLRASADERADLFWGIRGGGGNFGVVTEFEFRLHELGTDLYAGLVVHSLDDARDVLREYRSYTASAPDNVACWFVMRKAPPLPFLPEEWHGRDILAIAICINGPLDEAERLSMPIRRAGRPIAEHVGPVPYLEWQKLMDPLMSPPARNYWKSHDFYSLPDGLIDVLIEHARRIPDPQTEIAWAHLGAAVGRVPADATAYAHRDAEYVINIHGRWDDRNKDAECIGWTRELFHAVAPYSTGGVYVNFMTAEESDRVRLSYGQNYDRLVELKNEYDPGNLFRINQNIQPSIRKPSAR